MSEYVFNKGAKYPESINREGERPTIFFKRILTFHIPPEDKPRILDPTCGEKHLWKGFTKRQTKLSGESAEADLTDYDIVFSDIEDKGQEIVSDVRTIDEEVEGEFDGIIYDPPYLFGVQANDDPRDEDYGSGYNQDFENLLEFMGIANSKFPPLLKNDGKLIVKCSDQYVPDERRFYCLHNLWINNLTRFNLIDLFVAKYLRSYGTAYQVKNRPCSIVSHTYFLVFKEIKMNRSRGEKE